MKIIIFAAGIGSRLGNPFPKPLTPLKNGKSIMQRQIDNITTYFDVNDITTASPKPFLTFLERSNTYPSLSVYFTSSSETL